MKPSDLTDKMRTMLPLDAKRDLGAAGMTLEEVIGKHAVKTEREIHDQIGQWLNSKGVVYQHERMDKKTRGRVGWPDFTFAWLGSLSGIPLAYPVAVEVKRPGETPTQDQLWMHGRMTSNGWKVYVVHSFAELVEQLKRLR
jgi:hypothetical protein